ncbi:sensor domain-containing diguanylate cyclase, partial [Klebsiella pneumoniae]|nr:sensor domain-containing diguanylate cyclase [Klebsiella pneumoniae]
GTPHPPVARFNRPGAPPWPLAFSWGCVEYDPAHHPSLNALVATADRLMYQAKQKQGRERR